MGDGLRVADMGAEMTDELVMHCPTCGHSLPTYKFKPGDKVRPNRHYEMREILGMKPNN
jgi:hypothetical protein